MHPVLMGVIITALAFIILVYWMLFREGFIRLLAELLLAFGLAYLFKILGLSTFMAYLAAGLTLAALFFVRRNPA
ncbi:MAG TPA: hypothetical protein ENN60_02245 [archaeon]|nr:hypothetical protein [archaeon]